MTEAQLTCMSDFVQELWQAGWDRDSIHQVEQGVLAALYGEQETDSNRRTLGSKRASFRG
jgi:hypothetical protein